jgi:iron(III) transport system substrate-binding protein
MYKINMRLLAPFLLLLALMFMLAGCATEESVEEPEEPEEVVEEEEGIFIGGELIADKELYDAAIKEGTVIVYTAQVADHEQQLVDGFMAQFPEIKVEVLRLAGHRLHERVMTEWAANQMEADFIVQSEATYILDYAQQGLLLENLPPTDDKYPDYIKIPGYVYPITMSPMIIQYNSEIIAEEDAPKDWPDLLDPKYKGLVGHTRGGGGSPYAMFLTLEELYGWEYIEDLAANESVIFTGGSGVTTSLVSGEIHVALLGVMSSYPTKVYMGAPIEYVYPESGAAPYVAMGGIPATASHPNAAKLFMNWYLSNVGQTRISSIRGTYSYHPDVMPPPGVPLLTEIKMHNPDMQKLYYDLEYREAFDNRWNETMQYFE